MAEIIGSMRARITLLATTVAAAALVAASVLLVLSLDRSLTRSGDDVSRARAQEIAGQVADGTLPPRLVNIGEEGIAQVVTLSGRVLAASANIAGAQRISRREPRRRAQVAELVAPDDSERREHYRVWAVPATGPAGRVTVYVGTSLESVTEATRTVRRSLFLGVPVLLLLLAGLTWLLTGRTLRPVEGIRREVQSISGTRLDRRVPVPATGDEVAELAVTMNQMLDRLEDASRRERAFVADASHELQSPLTSLRTQLEVGVASPEGWSEVGALEAVDQLEQLVRNLLFLARSEGGEPERRLLDLDDLVLEEVARLRGHAAAAIETTGVSAAPVLGDADQLRRAVRNVLENAVRHAASTVEVSVDVRGSQAVVRIVDDGPGVPPEDRERIFERFVTSGGRSSGGGSGLGLPIARTVAERHGGTLVLLDTASGAAFELTLPVAD